MGRARSLGSAQQSVCLSCHDGHLSCPQSVWEKFFFFILREEGRGSERKEGRRGKKKAREKGQEREGSLERAEEKRQKKEKMEGDIDCSQAEGALCGAWWWALRTPGLSLLSGPEEEQTHISLRVGDLCKCACNCMSCFFIFISKGRM